MDKMLKYGQLFKFQGKSLEFRTVEAGASAEPSYSLFVRYAQRGIVAAEYVYNKNGALTQDFNGGIYGITYNLLNLPNRIQFRYGHNTQYVYDAAGVKRQTIHETAKRDLAVPMGTTEKKLGSGTRLSTLTTDYCAGGHIVYENGALKRILTPEGYLDKNSVSAYRYYYYLKDHLGNNRSVIGWSGGSYASYNNNVAQETNYYPFGMPYPAAFYGDAYSPEFQFYKFGGKELDEMHSLNWADFEARLYDGIVPRFTTMDPLAEKHYSVSTYAYCGNNPVRYKDPTGKWIVGTDGKPVTYTKGIWSSNASSDVRRIGNAMSLTKTGTKQLKSMLYKLDKISMSFSSEIMPEGKGIRVGNTRREARRGSDGSVKVTEEGHKITIYDKAIEQNISQDAGNNPLKGLSMEEAIGVVATHESGHTEEENTTQSYENVQESGSHDLEAHSTQLENNALQELEEQKQRIRQEIINLRRP